MATTVPTSTPMTAAELLKHPEFPHVHWHLQPTKSGKVPVAAGRGGPFNLDWEIHGNGPIRLVVSTNRRIRELAWLFVHEVFLTVSICTLRIYHGFSISAAPAYSKHPLCPNTLSVSISLAPICFLKNPTFHSLHVGSSRVCRRAVTRARLDLQLFLNCRSTVIRHV